MADWPPLVGDCTKAATFGQNYATTLGTVVTAGANQHQKGTPQAIIPTGGLAFDANGLLVSIYTAGTVAHNWLIDIGLGDSAVPVLSNLLLQPYYPLATVTYYLPLAIPAGTRVSLTAQSSLAGGSVLRAMVTAISQGFLPPTGFAKAETLGAVTSNTTGTSIDSGVNASTKGAWAPLGTLARPCSALLLAVDHRAVGLAANARWFLDIAVGAEHTVVLPDLCLSASVGAGAMNQVAIGPIPLSIPAGSALSARAQCSGNVPNTRLIEMVVCAFS